MPNLPPGATWPEEVRAAMSVYSSGYEWCRRCDVGWMGAETACWLCKRDDEVYRWRYKSHYPEFGKVGA
jgi:hypothetical protein